MIYCIFRLQYAVNLLLYYTQFDKNVVIRLQVQVWLQVDVW